MHDAQTASALSPPKFAEFSADNEIVCLNPDTTPVPKIAIKEEVAEDQDTVEAGQSSDGGQFESFHTQEGDPETIHGLESDQGPSTSKSTSKSSTPSPPRQKATFAKAVLDMLSPKGPRTRGRVVDTHEYVPTAAESAKGLAEAEAKGRKKGKKTPTKK